MSTTPHILHLSPRLRGAMTGHVMTDAECAEMDRVLSNAQMRNRLRLHAHRMAGVRLVMPGCAPVAFIVPIIPADDDDGMPPPVAPALPVPVQQAAG